MSAKKLSRAFAQGEIKKLRRMKQPLGQILLELAPPLPPRARKARREEGAGRHQQLTSNDALRARGDNPKGRGPLPHPASLMAAGGYVSTARPSPRDSLHESTPDVLARARSPDNTDMKQSSLGLSNTVKRTRKREFLDAMELVVPWAELVALIEPYAPESGRRGQQPFAVQTLLRIHFMQQWFKLSDPAMEEALHDVPAFRDFAGLSRWDEHIPSESSILRFRHLLERHKLAEQILATVNALLQAKGLQLKAGTVVDATLIAAPSSTKNQSGERDPEMHQSKKGNQWYFGMKAHIGVDADSGLVHTVRGTSGNVNDVVEANSLLHGQETDAFGDAGYQGADKRPDARQAVCWHVAMRPGLRRALDKDKPLDDLIDQLERTKARIRAKVEHPFRVLKQQFGYVKVRYRGLKKNTAQIVTLFALSNLWMARHKLQAMAQVRVQEA